MNEDNKMVIGKIKKHAFKTRLRTNDKISEIEESPFLTEEEKQEKINNIISEPPMVRSLPLSAVTKRKQFIYQFIKKSCPSTYKMDFTEENITAFDLFMHEVCSMVLEDKEAVGLIIEQAYDIRVEDQKQFFLAVKNLTKKYSSQSAHQLLNDLNEVVHNFMLKIKTLSNSDDKLDIAGASQILKNIEGYLKLLIPMSKVLEANNDATEELKRAKIKQLQGDGNKVQRIQNQYNIIQIDASIKEKYTQEINGQINDTSYFAK